MHILMTIDLGILGWFGQILGFSIDLHRRSYNTDTTVPVCGSCQCLLNNNVIPFCWKDYTWYNCI